MNDATKKLNLEPLAIAMGGTDVILGQLRAFLKQPAFAERFGMPPITERTVGNRNDLQFNITNENSRTCYFAFLASLEVKSTNSIQKEIISELKQVLLAKGLAKGCELLISSSLREYNEFIVATQRQKHAETLYPYSAQNRSIHGGLHFLVTGNPEYGSDSIYENLIEIPSVSEIAILVLNGKGVAQGPALFDDDIVRLDLSIAFPSGRTESVYAWFKFDGPTRSNIYFGGLAMKRGYPEQYLASKIAVREVHKKELPDDWKSILAQEKEAFPSTLQSNICNKVEEGSPYYEIYKDAGVGTILQDFDPNPSRRKISALVETRSLEPFIYQ